MSDVATTDGTPAIKPAWKPLSALDRRVLGVLVEKAKTTPDAYPLSLNALRAGCNQKSNRYPMMEVEEEDLEPSLERLRMAGAAIAVQSSGRVSRYRHCAYEWLGVDKVELAVMAELLLRGAQTEGELRGRAARMEPIDDLSALRPVLASLKAKGLVIPLTHEGRGHVLTHALYEPRELEHLRTQYSSMAHDDYPMPASASTTSSGSARTPAAVDARRHEELDDLRNQIAQLRSDLADLSARFDKRMEDLDRLKDSLG